MSTVLVRNKGLGDRAIEVNERGDEGRDVGVIRGGEGRGALLRE